MSDVRHARMARMLDDAALHGDLLLVGLGFARFLDFGGIPEGKKLNTTLVARCVFPQRPRRSWWIQRTLAEDARGYRLPMHRLDRFEGCGAPMIRRAGTCNRDTSTSGYVTDWETEEATAIGACSRHRDWFWETTRANQAAKPERLVVPAANHGGVLARHIPEFDWPAIWKWATDGRWVEHPEREPWKPPTFTLVLGDGQTTSGNDHRPRLAPVGAS